MVLFCREKKLSRRSSLKVLDYSMQGAEGTENCSKFIEFLGLRSLFPLFMKVTECCYAFFSNKKNKIFIVVMHLAIQALSIASLQACHLNKVGRTILSFPLHFCVLSAKTCF